MSLAAFNKAMQFISRWEGGYSNDRRDPGGETYRGVARKRNPDWPGWRRIDAHKEDGLAGKELEKRLSLDGELQRMVLDLYRQNYWNAIHGDELPESVAIVTMDAAVNMGPRAAVQMLQQAVGVPDDGKIGPQTLGAVRLRGEAGVRDALVNRLIRYCNIISARPSQGAFMRGWFRRVVALALET